VEKQKKLKSKKRIGAEVSVNSPGESMETVLKKIRKATGGRICRKRRL